MPLCGVKTQPMAQGGAFVRTLWERDRDPFLDHVRWRLHLRLLLVSALAAAAFALLNRMQHGSFGAVTLPLAACLALWLLLSRSPDGNRLAVRANLALFVLVAAHEALAGGGPFPSALLALMVMPVCSLNKRCRELRLNAANLLSVSMGVSSR